MSIVLVPEMVRAPVVTKVPVTLGNVEKSYVPVIVIAWGVVEVGVGDTQPVVKNAISTSAIATEKSLFFFIIRISFFLW